MESVERNQPQCVELRLHSDKTRRPDRQRPQQPCKNNSGTETHTIPLQDRHLLTRGKSDLVRFDHSASRRPAVDDDDTIRADVPLMYNDKRSVGMSLDSASLSRHTLSKTLSTVNMSTLLFFFVCFF